MVNTEKLEIRNKEGEFLRGERNYSTASSSILPTVILAHGYGMDRHENRGMFDEIVLALTSQGIQVFRFDFSGCGESEGDYFYTTLSKLSSDFRTIIEFVKNRSDVGKIGIVGMSLGTATISALLPLSVSALVYLGSASTPHETLKILFGDGYNPGGVSYRIKKDGRRFEHFSGFWDDFDKYNLLNLMRKNTAPILFIHGERDESVPVSSAQLFFENTNTPKDLIVVPNAGHAFLLPEERKIMVDHLVGWFSRYLLI